MFTEKAFPEDETVLTTVINTKGAAAVTNTLSYENDSRPQPGGGCPAFQFREGWRELAGRCGRHRAGDETCTFFKLENQDRSSPLRAKLSFPLETENADSVQAQHFSKVF